MAGEYARRATPFICLIVACAHSAASWPTQSYPEACPRFRPSPPICLAIGASDGRFNYRDQFAACRSDMEAYGAALDRWVRCAHETMEADVEAFTRTSADRLRCYADSASTICPAAAHDIDRHYAFDIREPPPPCITSPNFAPSSDWAIEQCTKDVEAYLDAVIRAVRRDEPRRIASQAAEDALRTFECIARAQGFCFYPSN
jgi:hypothetical protein